MSEPSVGVPFIDYFLSLLAEHGYVITFGFAVVENLFLIGSIIPGETIQVAAGFVSSSGVIDPFLLWGIAFAGSFLGSNITYFMALRGGRPWLERNGHRFRVSDERIRAAEVYFERHGNKTILLSKWVAGFKNFAPAIAGVSKMPLLPFEAYSLLASFLYTSMLIAGGYFFGEYLETVVALVKGSAWAALGLVVLVVGYSWFRVRLRRRRQEMVHELATADPTPEESEG